MALQGDSRVPVKLVGCTVELIPSKLAERSDMLSGPVRVSVFALCMCYGITLFL